MRYVHFSSIQKLRSLHTPKKYKCLLIIETRVSDEEQVEISRWLVESGCLYMMAWGIDCSSWDDSVDLASIEMNGYEESPDAQVIMTTWHDSNTLEEVFEFAKHAAITDGALDIIVLHFSDITREKDFATLFESA